MQITAPCLVEIAVRLFDRQGGLLEETSEPLAYLHGASDIFPALEARLEGHQAGDTVVVDLEPTQAFGDYDADRVHLVKRSLLGGANQVGARLDALPGRAADGITYRVTDLADDVAVLDGNHPYAGIDLRFEIKVVQVTEVDPTRLEEPRPESRPPPFLRVAGAPAPDDTDDTDDE